MEETKFETAFYDLFDECRTKLDLDYIQKFIARAANGLFKKYGAEEISDVLKFNRHENQDLENDLRWIIEVGALFNIFQMKLEISEIDTVNKLISAILYQMNKHMAQELVQRNILPVRTNILYSYKDLAHVFEGSRLIYLQICCDPQTKSLMPNAKNILYSRFANQMLHLLT